MSQLELIFCFDGQFFKDIFMNWSVGEFGVLDEFGVFHVAVVFTVVNTFYITAVGAKAVSQSAVANAFHDSGDPEQAVCAKVVKSLTAIGMQRMECTALAGPRQELAHSQSVTW